MPKYVWIWIGILVAVILICVIISMFDKKKQKELKKAKNREIKTATITKKEVKRPFMRAVAMITMPIFITLIIICISLIIACFCDVLAEKDRWQELAEEVTDEEWEMYENYLDEDGEELSSHKIEEIEESAQYYKKHLSTKIAAGTDYDSIYYGYGSYDEWDEEVCSSLVEKYKESVIEEVAIIEIILILATLGTGAIWFISKKAYKVGQDY